MEDKHTQCVPPRGEETTTTREVGTMATATLDDDGDAKECTQQRTSKRLTTSFCHDKHNTSTRRPLLFTLLWALLRRAHCELGFQAGGSARRGGAGGYGPGGGEGAGRGGAGAWAAPSYTISAALLLQCKSPAPFQ